MWLVRYRLLCLWQDSNTDDIVIKLSCHAREHQLRKFVCFAFVSSALQRVQRMDLPHPTLDYEVARYGHRRQP